MKKIWILISILALLFVGCGVNYEDYSTEELETMSTELSDSLAYEVMVCAQALDLAESGLKVYEKLEELCILKYGGMEKAPTEILESMRDYLRESRVAIELYKIHIEKCADLKEQITLIKDELERRKNHKMT